MPPSPAPNSASPGVSAGQHFPGHLRANVTGRGMGSYDSQVDSLVQGTYFISLAGKDMADRLGLGISNVSVTHQ